MTADPLEEIEALLDRICGLVRSGQLGLLADLESQLIQLEPALEGADPLRLTVILGKAERNQRLLRAAGRGVRSAQRRLTEIARALEGLSTYDHKGQLQPRGLGAALLTKRF